MLPLEGGVLDLVENTDKELRDDGQAGACAAQAGIQTGGDVVYTTIYITKPLLPR